QYAIKGAAFGPPFLLLYEFVKPDDLSGQEGGLPPQTFEKILSEIQIEHLFLLTLAGYCLHHANLCSNPRSSADKLTSSHCRSIALRLICSTAAPHSYGGYSRPQEFSFKNIE